MLMLVCISIHMFWILKRLGREENFSRDALLSVDTLFIPYLFLIS